MQCFVKLLQKEENNWWAKSGEYAQVLNNFMTDKLV